MRRLAGAVMVSSVVAALAAPASAHGGCHPTPWPSSVTMTSSYTPATYFPTFFPSAPTLPALPTTPVTPASTPTRGGSGSGPSGPTSPSGSGPSTATPAGPTGPSRPAPGAPAGPKPAPGAPAAAPGGPQAPNAPAAPPVAGGGGAGAPAAPAPPAAPGGGAPVPPGGPAGAGAAPAGPVRGAAPHYPTSPTSPTPPGFQRPTGRRTPPGSPSRQTVAADRSRSWENWWQRNQWRFLEARSAGAQQTGRDGSGPGEVQEALAEFLTQLALRDSHREPRAAAAIALGKIGALHSRQKLEQLLLKEGDDEVRQSAALALGMMQAHASAELLHRIVADRAQEPSLRVYAATALGLMRDPSAVAPLLQLLTARDRVEVHVAAVMAVGVIGDPAALDHLLKVAQSLTHHPAVRAAAVTSLGKCGAGSDRHAEVLTALGTLATTCRHDDVRRAVALILPRFADRRALAVLQRLVHADRDDVTVGFAMLSLAELAGAVEDPDGMRRARNLLARRLTAGARREQGYAALALGLLGRGDGACATLLAGRLGSVSNAATRGAVAIGLGLCGDAAAAAPLAELARDGSTDLLRGYACVALGMVGARHPSPAITEFLTGVVVDVNIPELRAAAALGLSKMGGSPRALEALRRVVRSRNRYLKLSAILTLGYFRDPATIKDFVELFAEEGQPVARALAVVALGHLGETQRPPVLRRISADFNYLAVHDRMRDLEIILRLY